MRVLIVLAHPEPASFNGGLAAVAVDTLAHRLETPDATEPMRFNGWDDWDETGRLKPGRAGYSPFMRAEP